MSLSTPPSSSAVSLIPHVYRSQSQSQPQPERDFSAAFASLVSQYGLNGAPRVRDPDAPTNTVLDVSPRCESRRWYALFSRRKSSASGTFHKLNSNPKLASATRNADGALMHGAEMRVSGNL
ncbi:unnamed protein product [Rhizoctonia solani]|uniref:Uncharacterized protein n=1 Tax=Rhizoctonia solani TaxID=456999 RepID=A0A8H3D4K7_9AGAM|nr:unnamed protein product [Rhizoctonia solani]